MATSAYRHKDTGTVIAVASDSALEDVVTGSGAYEAASIDDLATSDPALGPITGPTAGQREERNGWLIPPGGSDQAVTAASFQGASTPGSGAATLNGGQAGPEGTGVDARITEAYAVDTVEGVNGYLDDHKDDADLVAAVLAHEAANRNRTGIVEGRHKAADAPITE